MYLPNYKDQARVAEEHPYPGNDKRPSQQAPVPELSRQKQGKGGWWVGGVEGEGRGGRHTPSQQHTETRTDSRPNSDVVLTGGPERVASIRMRPDSNTVHP